MLTECIDAETLALFAEGKLSRAEMRPVLEHVTECESCRRIVKIAAEHAASLDRPSEAARSRRWPYAIAVAASLILVLLAIPAMRRMRTTSVDRLIDLAPRSARLLEPRVAGGFPFAPWRGTERAGNASTNATRLKLGGVAGELMERADAKKTAEAQHAAGVALLLAERPLDAIPRLRDAVEREPGNAQAWSDLAAARYAAASVTGRASLYPEALAAADRALRIDAAFAEALFNRALVLERMGVAREAHAAWRRYLEVDASSPWAEEAREHMRRLAVVSSESQFQNELPVLERAAVEGDAVRVAAIVASHPQMSRLYAEGEFLGKWAEAKLRGDPREAERMLAVARAVGTALERRTGEAMVARAVHAVDHANPEQRRVLADAHATYRRARIAYSRNLPAEAEPELRRAALLFHSARSPMAELARYFAACTRYDRNDLLTARAELASVLADADSRPELIALGAQVRWQLSLCLMSDDDWSGSLALLRAAESAFDRLGERNHLGFIRALIADALAGIGRSDESWNSRIQSFALQSAEGRRDHFLAVSFGSAARTALRAESFDAARSLLELEIDADRRLKNDVLLTDALARSAVLNASLGDDAAASRLAAESTAVARRIEDQGLRDRALDHASFASGAAALHSTPQAARELLTRAIDGYRRNERPFFLPEAHLLRARAARELGDLAAAADDLERGISELERHRIGYSGTVIGTGVYDAGRALFHEAIRVALQRSDPTRALLYAERSRPQVAGTARMNVAELQRRLRGSGTAVLEIVSLPDETVMFSVTADAFSAWRRPLSQRTLAALASRSANDESDALSQLYDALVKPAERALVSGDRLLVVADPVLDAVPFGALYDVRTQRRLIERVPVALSLNALSLRDAEARTIERSLVTVSLPEGELGGSKALPHVREELSDVRRLYAQSSERASLTAAAGTLANVLHIAGHTEVRGGSVEAMLGFARPNGSPRDWVSWQRIAGERLPGTTVVLAACETLRRPDSPQTFALSLGGGFVAAGADDVIGTLAAIGDRDAQRIFYAIHRQLATGADPVVAVRRAQLEELSQRPANGAAWFAVSVLTNRIQTGAGRGLASQHHGGS